jgi:lysyl-tRNA synthetase class 2
MKLQRSVPLWIGRATFLVGLFDILANVSRRIRNPIHRLDHILPVFLNASALATAIFTGLILMILASGLARRKHRAWTLTLIILAVNLATEIFRSSHHPLQIFLSVILIIILGFFRKSFYAKSDPSTKSQPLIGFGLAVIVLFVASLLLLKYRSHDEIIGSPSYASIFLFIIEGFVGVAGPVHFASERASDLSAFTLGTFGVFIVLVPMWLYFRRIKPIPKMSDADMDQVRLLIKHDLEQDSLGYFATRRDKSVVWSANRKAGIAYRVQGGVMLASGDPFGEYSLWPDAIKEFIAIAEEHAWTPAVMGCSDHGGEVWVEHAGMIAVDIGDEAIIQVNDFTLEGRPMANVRQMVNRIRRKGYTSLTLKWSDVDPQTQAELRKLAHEWRYGVAERGFSMSMDRFGEVGDPDTYITIARLNGEIKGLQYYVPWTTDGLSLDRMQRERGTDAGINELMIVDTVEYARANNLKHVSLNFAAFRSLFERADKISAGPITRGRRNVLRFFSNFFQVESLYRFNAKFQPEWETRYVLYPRATDLPKVAWAALRAEKFISGWRKKSI